MMFTQPFRSMFFVLLLSVGFAARAEEPAAHPVPKSEEPVAGTEPAIHKDLPEPAKEAAAPIEGLWLTSRQQELLLKRWAEDISVQFDLNAEQKEKVRERVVRRWTGYLNENRSKILPVVNEFIEMRLELEPPAKERVQKWADSALPLMDGFRQQLREGQSEFREMLTFKQRAKFEIEAMKFEAGLALAESKLKQWKEGEYKVEELWDPPRAERRRRRAEQEKKEAEVKPAEPDDQIALEVKRWEEYVAEFVKLYDFDQGQRDAALSCLTELRERALAHRDRRKDDIARLESRIQSPSNSKEDLQELKKQLDELYGPVDDMFKDLRSRLEQIPTVAQRESVSQKNETNKKG